MKQIATILFACLTYFAVLAQAPQPGDYATDPDVIEFGFITDTHGYGPSADVRYAAANVKAFVNYCNETPGLQFAMFGGDFMNAYNTNHDQARWCLEHARRDYYGLKLPLYATKGNHDCNGKQRTADGKRDNSQIISSKEFSDLFSPLSPTNPLADSTDIIYNPEDRDGGYFYRDFKRQHFRLIMLNDYDIDSLEWFGYHGRQMKWLAEKGLDFSDKDDPEQWSFMIVGHGFSVNMMEHPISRLLHAYTLGEDFEDNDRGFSYSGRYSRIKRAHFVGMLGGHQHDDIYTHNDGYNMIIVTRGFATGGEVGVNDVCFDHFILNTRTHMLTEHRIGRGRDRIFSYGKNGSQQLSPKLTFPEADGMGIYTHGGREGREILVTNLNDDGRGSLRWAVNQKGNRMITFRVSGTIELKSPLIIANDSVSICGHSAPSQGICLAGAPVKILASEVIIRYLHVRPGQSSNGELVDAISDGDFGQHHIMLDHLSVSWSSGSCIALRRTRESSVQHCLLSHTLDPAGGDSLPPVEADRIPAALVAGGYMNTYHRNLIANTRNAIQFPSEEGENRWIHIIRNVIYNWRDHAMFGGGRQGEITIESNYLIPGPATRNYYMLEVADDGTGRYNSWGNLMKGYERYQWNNNGMIKDHVGFPYDPLTFDAEARKRMGPVASPQRGDFANSCMVIAAFHYKPLFDFSTHYGMWRSITRIAGCSRQHDNYDTQLLASIRAEEAFGSDNGLIGNPQQVGGWPKLPKVKESPSYDNLPQWLDDRVKPVKSIVILYENDVHGNVEGYPYLAGYRDAISADTALVGIVSCGGYIRREGGKDNLNVLQMMRYTGYDAVALGNGEFIEDINRLYKDLHERENLDQYVTSCNLRSAQGTNQPLFKPYIIHQFDDRRVAFVGVSTPHAIASHRSYFLSKNGKLRYTLSERDLYQTVQQTVDEARTQGGADYVVVLSTLGEGSNLSKYNSTELIRKTRGIDAVLDGYTLSAVASKHINNCDGQPVLLSRTNGRFQEIGKLIIAPDGIITSQLIPVKNLMFKHPATTHVLDSINEGYNYYADIVIGKSLVDLRTYLEDSTIGITSTQEMNTGNLVTDALRFRTGADIAIINSGGMQKGIKAGPVRRRDVYALLPFDNQVILLQVRGTDLLHLFSDWAANPKAPYIQIAGLQVKAKDGKLVSIHRYNAETNQFEDFDATRNYTLATIDYCIHHELFREVFEHCPEVVGANTPSLIGAVNEYIMNDLKGIIDEQYAEPQGRIIRQ